MRIYSLFIDAFFDGRPQILQGIKFILTKFFIDAKRFLNRLSDFIFLVKKKN
jgi:hypothetical protein